MLNTDVSAQLPEDAIPAGRAANMVKTAPSTIWRWVLSGRIPGWKRAGRLLVSEADVRAQVQPLRPRVAVKNLRRFAKQSAPSMRAHTRKTLERFGVLPSSDKPA